MPTSTHTEAARLLPLDVSALSEQQKRGVACVYDRAPLGVNAIDLGQRPHSGVTVFPRACALCIPAVAERVLADHRAHCEQCVEADVPCDTREQLLALIRQYRPRQIAYCNWHGGLADTCEPIRDTPDQGSGHGGGVHHACARCREMHGLTPLGEQP
ncbi:hypothetical protein [Streptomyces ipomoeae]|uniref:hypothetical protein n=1 Tax=Streptomyces ipomoeae TaxID=103232 RepID=UPI0029B79DA7|nr:hypothetical protein [Streptomyces ipomoeae]MDX2697124.1 hypothetical protein [Streptomyces ipomoeae]